MLRNRTSSKLRLHLWGSLFAIFASSVVSFADDSALIAEPVNKAAVAVEMAIKETDPPARTMFIRLEKIKEADRYDIEVIPVHLKWSESLKFRTYVGTLRMRLTPSEYRIRTRSVTKNGSQGGWGAWTLFKVPFRTLTDRSPVKDAVISSTGSKRQFVTFEWPEVKQAAGYYLEVHSKDGTVLKKIATTDRWLNYELDVGSEYSWCVVPVNTLPPVIAPGECVLTRFEVRKTAEALKRALTSVVKRDGALGYQFEIIRFADSTSLGDPIIVQSLTPDLRAELEPGEYELRARALFIKEKKTGWSSPKKFFVPHRTPVALSPGPGFEMEGDEDSNGKIVLKWKAEANAAEYVVSVFKENGELVLSQPTPQTELDITVEEDQKYYWQLQAYSKGEPRRSPASTALDVNNASTFYVKPYLPFSLTAAENPAPVYGWARYTVSSANYYSQSFDDNAIVRQSIQAGQLDVAAGYWHRKSRLGVLAGAGIQNYRTAVESAFQKSASVNVGLRLFGEGNRRARVWLGYAYREIPSLIANPSTLAYSISHLSTAGPQIIFTVSDTLNEKMGYQLHGRFFKGLQDFGTPTNAPQESAIAIAATAGLTYRLSNTSIGLVGYTFQMDTGAYSSLDTPGMTNTTSLTGHYLTLGLEFAIGDPKK